MANLSSYIKISANTVTTSGTVSTTGNVLAANVSVTGNVTGTTLLGNLVGTTVSATGNVSVGGILSSPQQTKASNATGSVGEICWDATYIYVCTATNTWKRVALTGGY